MVTWRSILLMACAVTLLWWLLEMPWPVVPTAALGALAVGRAARWSRRVRVDNRGSLRRMANNTAPDLTSYGLPGGTTEKDLEDWASRRREAQGGNEEAPSRNLAPPTEGHEDH